MRRIPFSLLLVIIACPVWAAASPVKINIAWRYKDFAAPVTIYEVKGQPRLWHTASVAGLADAPVTMPITGSAFQLEPGKIKRFALVAQNTADQPLYFFAAPHTVQPEEDALGFKFKCLCTNQAYAIGPKQTWYRIVEFRLSPDFVGKELTITHTLIGIDKERAASFSKKPVMPDM